jgi:hypothetical protein
MALTSIILLVMQDLVHTDSDRLSTSQFRLLALPALLALL